MLSAVIITYNEARNIGRCLDSLTGVADEIVVVDSFSTDATEQICREKGALFLQHSFHSYSEQKNYANAQARYDWVLSMDADEALSDPLKNSILMVKAQGFPLEGYAMNRLTNYCGQWIRHSGWYPDRKLRLFDRRKGYWGGPNPHEKLITADGARIGRLQGDLLHYSYYTEEEHWLRARKYAQIAATNMLKQGRRSGWWRLLFNPALKFVRNYFLRLGFLDGRAGLHICYVSAVETYWKYRGLLRLQAGSEG